MPLLFLQGKKSRKRLTTPTSKNKKPNQNNYPTIYTEVVDISEDHFPSNIDNQECLTEEHTSNSQIFGGPSNEATPGHDAPIFVGGEDDLMETVTVWNSNGDTVDAFGNTATMVKAG